MLRGVASWRGERLGALFGVAVVCALSLGSCSRSSTDSDDEAMVRRVVYDVRGRVVTLPTPGNPASEFRVHHEPIPDFRDNFHSPPVGMNAMVMPFPPAPGLDLSEIEVGRVVLVTFEVDHEADTGELTGWRAIRVRPLPDDTELDLGRAGDR